LRLDLSLIPDGIIYIYYKDGKKGMVREYKEIFGRGDPSEIQKNLPFKCG
jgi:hypothetical protein